MKQINLIVAAVAVAVIVASAWTNLSEARSRGARMFDIVDGELTPIDGSRPGTRITQVWKRRPLKVKAMTATVDGEAWGSMGYVGWKAGQVVILHPNGTISKREIVDFEAEYVIVP